MNLWFNLFHSPDSMGSELPAVLSLPDQQQHNDVGRNGTRSMRPSYLTSAPSKHLAPAVHLLSKVANVVAVTRVNELVTKLATTRKLITHKDVAVADRDYRTYSYSGRISSLRDIMEIAV
jgi:hypothetical protein